MCTTVERSTPYFSAASRWVACCVSTWMNSSYFSLGASRFLGLREDLRVNPVPGFCMISCLLKGDQLTHQVAGYFPRVLVHELRRGRITLSGRA